MFGALTTLNLGWSHTHDTVGENNGTAFVPIINWLGHAEDTSYSVGLSQIFTKNLIVSATFQVITDDGYLANPYRSITYLDPTSAKGYSLASQVYPDTRTSTAVQGQMKYYLPNRAAITGSYRFFRDTWGIVGHTVELDYTHPIGKELILEARARYYRQNSATFYSDLFSIAGQQNFEARDQNLASQNNTTIGGKATWAFRPDGWLFFKRMTLTGDIERIRFSYSDFRDIRDFGVPQYTPGNEPLYQFNAMVY